MCRTRSLQVVRRHDFHPRRAGDDEWTSVGGSSDGAQFDHSRWSDAPRSRRPFRPRSRPVRTMTRPLTMTGLWSARTRNQYSNAVRAAVHPADTGRRCDKHTGRSRRRFCRLAWERASSATPSGPSSRRSSGIATTDMRQPTDNSTRRSDRHEGLLGARRELRPRLATVVAARSRATSRPPLIMRRPPPELRVSHSRSKDATTTGSAHEVNATYPTHCNDRLRPLL